MSLELVSLYFPIVNCGYSVTIMLLTIAVVKPVSFRLVPTETVQGRVLVRAKP